MEKILENKPAFLDYKIKDIKILSARQKELKKGDLVTDDSGTIGKVKFKSEQFGNYIEFIDGFSVYDSSVPVKKISTTSGLYFEHQKRYFGFITRLAKIITESISDNFPFVNMFNNGHAIFVRGSTQPTIVKKFTNMQMGDNHSLFSAKLTPFYNCNIEILDIKKSLRKGSFTYLLLKFLFIDIDLEMVDDTKINFLVSEKNKYNDKEWERMIQTFRKFKITKV